jgi:hypothetical protein
MTITTMRLGHDTFDVTIRENNSETRHGVVLTDTLHKELAKGKVSKEECVRGAVRFLLTQEPKEDIFRRFDVASIETFFPDFRKKVSAHFEER